MSAVLTSEEDDPVTCRKRKWINNIFYYEINNTNRIMLLNDFYTLENQVAEGNQVKANISFNKFHRIFEGHFPGQPVVPGVCMMQILREVMEVELSQSLKIATGENLKFLSIINPEETPMVEVSIQYALKENSYVVNASLQTGTVTFFRFKGTFEPKA